ncbi:MacB-like core domain-containing protein [Anaerovirgula multivorans]|uniref:MacB-like core domain-containing protein n=1 Tax=Anaerovirgula multivorans TaxID=312168 RepID=A0A239IJ88_9FIRM|nr:ABC transporter permease [Anaerovirgula multivorans]SNS93472.1 MacB-like core domain-containing protein [Anaerovirgula multivorans]
MKKRKAVWILSFLGIFLILSFIIFGNGLVTESYRLNGKHSMEKVLVSVKNHMDSHSINAFSLDDINKLKRELSTEDISYIVQSGLINTSASNENRSLPVGLIGVDYMHSLFIGQILEEGSFITQQQEEEGGKVAVIDGELAWNLFKTEKAAGETIEIFGDIFRIVGVVKKENTLIEKLTEDGLPKVYIPAEVMLELDTTSSITALQIKTEDDDRLGENIIDISTALQQIGKNPGNYHIIDFNLRYELLKQWPLLFLFILGMTAILILLAYMKNSIIKLYFLIKDECKKDYFSNVIKHNDRVILAYSFEIALISLGVMLIWLGISFRPYIPPNYIPDELINISYYLDLIKNVIQGGIQNIGYVPPQSQLVMNTANRLMHLFFWITIVLGFLLLYTGFRGFKELNITSIRIIGVLSIFFFIALAILAALAPLIGLTFMLEVKDLLVTWSFIFLYSLHTTMRKERDINV